MKIDRLIKAFSLLLVVMFSACSDFEDTEILSPAKPAGNQGVFYPTSNVSAFELEPTDATQISVKVSRAVSAGAASIPVIVLTNDEGVFNVPATANFADGEKETSIVVTFPNAAEGITYKLKLGLEGDISVDPYGAGAITVSTQVTRIKWTPVANPFIYRDGTFDGAGWGDNSRPMYVYAEKAQLGASVRYRMKNVYAPATSSTPDADGVYNGFFSFTPGFDSSKDWYTVIEIHSATGTSGNVSMFKHEIGSERGEYGRISIGSKEGSFGKLASNKITFAAGSLLFYDNDGGYDAKLTTIYLTKEAYIKDNMRIVDFNDVEYEVVDGEVGKFESLSYVESWDQTLSKAIDIDSTNVASEYKNLYYLADLYAEGYGLAFYYDPLTGKVTIPENQMIGRKVFGQDLHVSPSDDIKSSVVSTFKDVSIYTFGLMFHFKDGTIVGNFAETFFFKEDELIYTKEDFLGEFSLTGGSTAVPVEIAEESANNFVITGINRADKVKAVFSSEDVTLSISPQSLADVTLGDITYNATWHTLTSTGASSTAILDFVFDLRGRLIVSDTSAGTGFRITGVNVDNDQQGGTLNSNTKPVFVPVFASEDETQLDVQSTLMSDVNAGSSFSIQGKKSTDKKKNIVF